jgi:flavorubredoxin
MVTYGVGTVLLGTAILTLGANRIHERPIEQIGAGGASGRALVVYQPGLSDYPMQVARACGEGLAERGWQVDLVTASARAPADWSPYQLVVVVSPTYWYTISWPVGGYLGLVRGAKDKRTVAVVTAAGSADHSLRALEERLVAIGATVVERHAIFTWAPNDEAHYVASENKAVGLTIARAMTRRLVTGPR